MRNIIALSVMGFAMLMAIGCTSNESTTLPADRAMADPMNYKPGFQESDISGGDLTNFDKKAFRRDVDNVLNP